MNKIKKQFKDFWTYCRLLKYGANASEKMSYRKFLPLLIAVVVCTVIIMGQLSSSGDSFAFTMFMPFMCGMAIATGVVTSYRPSLIRVSPFTPKQRVVFSYLATLLRGIIITVIWTAALVVLTLVYAFFVFIFTGDNMFMMYADEDAIRAISAYGVVHEILTWVIMVFSSYAISHIDSKKARNIAVTCFFVGAEILVLILVNACGFARFRYEVKMGTHEGFSPYFFLSSDVAVTIDYLARPWVVIVAEALLCIAAFGASLYASVLRYKSSKI